ncbi:hypothetical protein FSP39_012075 [Pinctada imbricata]|uniref:Mannosyltransferase n=1 Tax=Pinctada imbricata TaxID=66713 RepID=A0AA89CAK8_PINIB|nr:hypothetical protein FSP39_012075 [Pinctada imbricata]
MGGIPFGWEILVSTVGLIHLVMCPYTKVEESFNVQAIHDVLYHGLDIDKYDHLEFPGVVPRTFIGPIVISLTAAPFVYIAKLFEADKFFTQYIVRATLGVYVMVGLFAFWNAVQEKFGRDLKKWMILVTMSQFHFIFYSSRPLPNIFALSLVLLAFASWLRQQHMRFLWFSGAAILIFRAELAMYLGIILLTELASGRLPFKKFVLTCIPAGIVLLGSTVLIDSYFWQRWLWPEGDVFWYNTVMNKSSHWGTSPFLWYFYSALPRALSVSYFFVPFGLLIEPRLRQLAMPTLAFILIYSNLPHKELRFIVYTFPVFNVLTSLTVCRLWNNRNKSMIQKFCAMFAVSHLLANCATTAISEFVSHQNYPGGQAMYKLHQIEPNNTEVHVHIDVLTAQTGVTRFTELNNRWIYDKTENLEPGGLEMQKFTHLFIGEDELLKYYQSTHTVIAKIDSFDRIKIDWKTIPPVQIITKPTIWILKKNKPFR